MTPMTDDLTGKIFGSLTVIGSAGRHPKKRIALWLVRCVCGTEKALRKSTLTSGGSRSCGCQMRALQAAAHMTHGLKQKDGKTTPEYHSWQAMKTRCKNPKSRCFKDYGGRGIKVCDRWDRSFVDFLSDMGPRPPGTSLDRIDLSLGYEPGNCRWATSKQQASNRSDNVFLIHDGQRMCLAEWSTKTGLKSDAIAARLRRGWSVDRALTEPLLRKPRGYYRKSDRNSDQSAAAHRERGEL